ncbi:hypothetical protein [Kaistella flava (ex Peng et al. 2021)]|uniref:hypothetical protein n=1 Tax=Kaistella flava (ex Peng et al. 2021) TaxID=2038776 RepID=UPI001FC84146|nr:hypothetical protein [Kaistella flava (ex Peng et al. 2021)]
MKFLLPLFIIFSIVFRPLLPLVDYAVNYKNIVAEKCENTAKPQLSCNGKCYLAKELSKTENQTPKEIIRSNFIDVFITKEIWSFTKVLELDFAELTILTKQYNLYNSDYIFNIFHPPLV